MEKLCPICNGKMNKMLSEFEIPSLPFIKIPEWIKEAVAYECENCHFIGLWREKE